MGLEPDMVAALAANAQGHLAAVDVLASGALPAQLGLDPVVPGRVFAGDTIAVTSVLASYTDRGWTVATDGARHTVTSPDGTTALTIMDRGGPAAAPARRTRSGEADDPAREPSRTPSARVSLDETPVSPFDPARVAGNAARVRAGDIGDNAIVGYADSEQTGIKLLQRLVRGDVAVLKELGTEVPPDFDPHSREWGLGRQWDGKYVIVGGEAAAVDWDTMPGVQPVGHSHPVDEGRTARQRDFRYDFFKLVADPGKPGIDAHLVLPSAEDIQFMVLKRLRNHVVVVPYELVDTRHIELTPPGAPGADGRQIVFEISQGTPHGMATEPASTLVYSAVLTARSGGNVFWTQEVFALIPATGSGSLTFTKPGTLPASKPTDGHIPSRTRSGGADHENVPPGDRGGSEATTPLPLVAQRTSHGERVTDWALSSLDEVAARDFLAAVSPGTAAALSDVPAAQAAQLLEVHGAATLEAVASPVGGARLWRELELLGPETARGMTARAAGKGRFEKVRRHADNLEAARASIETATSLEQGSLIVDSQVAIAVGKLVNGESWATMQENHRAIVNELRRRANLPPLTADPPARDVASLIGDHDLRAANVSLGEVGTTPVALGGLTLTVKRTDPVYTDTLTELAKPPSIGGVDGAADRGVVADCLLADAGGGIPNFMTGDARIYANLAQRYIEDKIVPQMVNGVQESYAKAVQTQRAGGFIIKITGSDGVVRSLKIVPIPA
jgi:hypothetical protein